MNQLSAISISQKHSVLHRGGEFFVVYPTPGLEHVPTLALICRTEQQAQEQCDRLNEGLQ